MALGSMRALCAAAAVTVPRCVNQNVNNNMRCLVPRLSRGYGGIAMAAKQEQRRQRTTLLERNFMATNALMLTHVRNLSIQEITRNIQFCSDKPRNVSKDSQTLRLQQPCDKPVAVMISWLNAKQKHLAKYAKLYTELGYDVVITQITPWQLLWPTKGTQLVAAEMVKFLKNNEFRNGIVLHGFSVGGYLWGECLVHIARDLQQYQVILDSIKGQVWDSAADITEISVGVPRALFPRNPTLQNALRKYMIYHMKAFHEPATSHYIRSSQMFHTNLLRCPALFLVSKTDPVGTVEANTRVKDSWESNGVKATFQVWDRSPHVGHFMKHRDEYIEVLYNHLRQLNLANGGQEMKLRAKV